MPDRRPRRSGWFAALLFACATTCLAAAGTPPSHSPEIDGPLSTSGVAEDGSQWAAWVLGGPESSDLALARVDPASGAWSAPVVVDLGSPISEPSIEVDRSGNAFLVFADLDSHQIRLAVRPSNDGAWISAGSLSSPGIAASHPASLMVGRHLVVAFLEGDRTRIVTLELVEDLGPADGGKVYKTGLQEGPDVVDPLGRGLGDTSSPNESSEKPLRRRDSPSRWNDLVTRFKVRIVASN